MRIMANVTDHNGDGDRKREDVARLMNCKSIGHDGVVIFLRSKRSPEEAQRIPG